MIDGDQVLGADRPVLDSAGAAAQAAASSPR